MRLKPKRAEQRHQYCTDHHRCKNGLCFESLQKEQRGDGVGGKQQGQRVGTSSDFVVVWCVVFCQ
jgi:hypothetical protein